MDHGVIDPLSGLGSYERDEGIYRGEYRIFYRGDRADHCHAPYRPGGLVHVRSTHPDAYISILESRHHSEMRAKDTNTLWYTPYSIYMYYRLWYVRDYTIYWYWVEYILTCSIPPPYRPCISTLREKYTKSISRSTSRMTLPCFYREIRLSDKRNLTTYHPGYRTRDHPVYRIPRI